jgi:hypothetical protein
MGCSKGWTKFCNRENCKDLKDFNCYYAETTLGGGFCATCPQDCEDLNKLTSLAPVDQSNKLTSLSLLKQFCNDCRNCKLENGVCKNK